MTADPFAEMRSMIATLADTAGLAALDQVGELVGDICADGGVDLADPVAARAFLAGIVAAGGLDSHREVFLAALHKSAGT